MSKGKFLEDVINRSNDAYLYRGIALVDKVETSATVKPGHNGGKRVVYKAGPKVDYRGTMVGGVSVSLETKESHDPNGLPLKHIRDNQIDYMRLAVPFGEICMAIVYAALQDKFFRIHAGVVLRWWDEWQENKGKRGYNTIPYAVMDEVVSCDGIAIDYLGGIYDVAGKRARLDGHAVYRFVTRGKRHRTLRGNLYKKGGDYMDEQSMKLSDVGGGALSERFELSLQEVMKNIRDPNTDPKKARKIVIEVTITPNEQRSAATMKYGVRSSLAPARTFESGIMFGVKDGKYVVREIGDQIPGQQNMGNVVPMSKGE